MKDTDYEIETKYFPGGHIIPQLTFRANTEYPTYIIIRVGKQELKISIGASYDKNPIICVKL